MRVAADMLLSSLPSPWEEELLPQIQAQVAASGTKVIVLDDDPTGTQTVHGVTVLMDWSIATLVQALSDPEPVVYLLTNSRSMPLTRAQAINRDIAGALRAAHAAAGREFVIVSRSDSTLRGHYPGEVETLLSELDMPIDGILIIPFFLEGGRLTIADTHYVREGPMLIPAAETEYARDPTFGYRHSDLRAWVAEKHKGRVAAADVLSISLEDLRQGGPAVVEAKLKQMRQGQIGVVNAASYRDLEVFTAGLLGAEARGKRFLYRTAASFVRVRGGIAPQALLSAAELGSSERSGLVIVGSHVRKSTEQLEMARSLPDVGGVELPVELLLNEESRMAIIRASAEQLDEHLAAGRHALLYTSRERVVRSEGRTALQIGQSISEALAEVVTRLQGHPAWVIAKGGITSSDIATKGLGMRRAQVLGQAIAGIPIWRTGAESRWPGMTYVVFPGNVGEPNALARMIGLLSGEAGAHL